MDSKIRKTVIDAQSGNSEALGELYVLFKSRVISGLLHRGFNLYQAEDLCQEAFLQACEKIWQLRDPCAFYSWLTSIARRKGINLFRRARRLSPLQEDFGLLAVEDVSQDALDAEESAFLNLVVETMKPNDRDCLRAFYWKGNSLLQIAESFKIPIGTVKRRLHVARNRLGKILRAANLKFAS